MAAPDPIPVYAGDDLSFAFTYREGGGNNAPVDLTGATIMGALYPAYSPTPVDLTGDDGLAGPIDAANGKLGLGVRRATTAAYTDQQLQATAGHALHIFVITNNLKRTIGVWPLRFLSGRDLMQDPPANRVATDPLTGRTLTWDGPTDLFPGIVVLPLSIMGVPAEANAGEDYAFIPTVLNAVGTTRFALSGDPLVDGLSFSTSTGAISGNPTTGGVLTLTITVTDDVGTAPLGPFTLTVNEGSGLDLNQELSTANQPFL